MRDYDEDRSEFMKNKAIFLLMQSRAIGIIEEMSKERNLPEQNCWNFVFNDARTYQRVRETCRKYAIAEFRNVWTPVDFADRFVTEACQLSRTSLFEMTSKIRANRCQYKEDRSDNTEREALFLLR